MTRFAAIDIGTNSVLLLVAERRPEGNFEAVCERAEITRLGRGVDKSRRLSAEAMEDTVRVISSFADEARSLGVQSIAASATSAARDAQNGRDFLDAVRTRAGVEVEIVSGEVEAKLSFAAVFSDFGRTTDTPLVCIDIGGGSTEAIFGGVGGQRDQVDFRRSFDVGAVRLTERFVRSDPPSTEERAAVTAFLDETLSALPVLAPGARVVGVAGTVTTLFTLIQGIEPYDAARVHGGTISLAELAPWVDRLHQTALEQRKQLKGLQPKRADVIPAGALILQRTLTKLGVDVCTVSDRGLRWGLLADKFGRS